jgi:hypothetical protein
VPSDTQGPLATESPASESDAEPGPSAPRAPQGLIPSKAQRQQCCGKQLQTFAVLLRECRRRAGVDFVLTWLDADGQREVLSDSSKSLKAFLEEMQPDVAMPAFLRQADVARRLAYTWAADFSSLSAVLMQRAVRAMLDLLMQNRSLPFSITTEENAPAEVQQKYEWFPAKAVESWRHPDKCARPELRSVAAAAVQMPNFMPATLPRLLRKLDMGTRKEAALCST